METHGYGIMDNISHDFLEYYFTDMKRRLQERISQIDDNI